MTITIRMTDDEAHRLANDLRTAINRYEDHINTMTVAGQPRLAEQFQRQRNDAQKMIDLIEAKLDDEYGEADSDDREDFYSDMGR